jgi:glycine oxidase
MPALRELMAESARRWPGFAEELAGETGHDLGYDDAGTLSVALTADDAAEAGRAWRLQGLTPTALRDLEPALSPRVRAAVYAPGDHQVDPRRVVAALRSTGVPTIAERVVDLAALDADQVVVAAGHATAALTGLPVRPVKGQLLRLRGEPGLLRHVISGYADGRHIYLVPRADGEIVVGATQEERADRTVTAGGVLDLLRAAVDLVPALADLELAETIAGHRPATPDNAPLLGRIDGRTVVAAGHHRNGVLLAPVTADLIADLLVTGEAHPLLAAFEPRRFSRS